jgi:LacI family transcriptional regulator
MLVRFLCMQENKRATLIDVANAAGVGASTVSRYVRGGKSVSQRVAKRIEAAIAALGYEPNTLARGLRVGRSQTLGVLVPHVNNVFFGNALRTIQMEAQRRGFTVMLLMHQEDAKLQQEQLASLKRSRVDGIVLVPAANTSAQAVRALLEGTPVVAFDRPLHKTIDSITLENLNAGKIATEHLLGHGHRHILAVTGDYELHPLEWRMKGFQRAMESAGKTPEEICLRDPEQLSQDLCKALQRGRSPVTAILSLSYSVTISILKVLHDRKIPLRSIAFIGIDDLEFASLLDPELTTITQPTNQLAQMAVDQLMKRIEGSEGHPIRVAIPGKLTVRSSCGCRGQVGMSRA